MKIALVALALIAFSSCRVSAQVIGGESTYEDNFEHVPPEDREALDKKAGDAAKKDAGRATPEKGGPQAAH